MSLLTSKTDIFNPQWLDIVFSGRNKSYGAYSLRKENPRSTVKALVITLSIFISAIAAPTIINKIKGIIPKPDEKVKITITTILPPPPIDKVIPPPPAVEPPRPRTDVVRFPPMVVKPDELAKEKDPPTADELTKADPGQKDIKGNPDAPLSIGEKPGESDAIKAITEAGPDEIFISLENGAEYPGGIDKFYSYLSNAIHYPAIARENNVQGKVFMTFVVEKDGSLTDVKVLRGIGNGCDEEAVRVVKASKKWKPGMQNGRPVRQQYTVPIAFTLAEN
jgi:protein TonB